LLLYEPVKDPNVYVKKKKTSSLVLYMQRWYLVVTQHMKNMKTISMYIKKTMCTNFVGKVITEMTKALTSR